MGFSILEIPDISRLTLPHRAMLIRNSQTMPDSEK